MNNEKQQLAASAFGRKPVAPDLIVFRRAYAILGEMPRHAAA